MQKRLHIVTPLIESSILSHATKTKVYLKLDNCQPSGSFKLRGVGLAVRISSCFIYFMPFLVAKKK